MWNMKLLLVSTTVRCMLYLVLRTTYSYISFLFSSALQLWTLDPCNYPHRKGNELAPIVTTTLFDNFLCFFAKMTEWIDHLSCCLTLRSDTSNTSHHVWNSWSVTCRWESVCKWSSKIWKITLFFLTWNQFYWPFYISYQLSRR